MDFYKQYPSGLRLVAKQQDFFYTVSLGVFVDVGCVKEQKSYNGYSHLIEHLVFKGTAKRTCLQISEELDDIGANINAYTAKDTTCFYTKSASDDLEKCIDILSDMYFNASVPQDELEREKGVVTEEIKMCKDTPDDVCQDLISSALFADQSLGQTILGSVTNIKKASRERILSFKNKYYVPAATVIAVCGKFDFDELDALVQKYFESNCDKNAPLPDAERQFVYRSEFRHVFKRIEQSHLQLAWGGYSLKAPERAANNMLASILGGGMSSRLNQSVRERHGLAYSVYAYPSYYKNCGTFEIYAGLSPENNIKVCRLIQEEIVRLLNDGITERELERARIQAINALYMNVESNMTLMRLYGRSMLKLDEMFDLDADAESYKNVTAEDINAVARSVFSQEHASAYVGPQIDGFDAVAQLKI